jgi:metacaspase-1
MSAVGAYARHDMGGVFTSVMSLGKTAMGRNSKASKLSKATKTSPADVVGCLLRVVVNA